MARSPAEILTEARTIALVGASPRPERPSNSVMRYLLREGYHVIPVRPVGPEEILGQRRVPSLAEIDEPIDLVEGQRRVPSLAEIDEPIDLVDVFRRSEFCPGVAEEAVAAEAGALWLQLGIVSTGARAIAEAAGLDYVENECTAIVHGRLRS